MSDPKTSSGVWTRDEFIAQLKRERDWLTEDQLESLWEAYQGTPKPTDNERRVIAKHELRELSRSGPKLVYDLANCGDDGWNWFWNKWHSGTKHEFLPIRDSLRQIWSRKLNVLEANAVVLSWLSEKHKLLTDGSVVIVHSLFPDLRTGLLSPLPTNLPALVAMACLHASKNKTTYSRMKVCANPECAFPYFLAKRTTQKICERGECTQWAQRKYALDWWNDNRSKEALKKKRNKTKPKRKSRA